MVVCTELLLDHAKFVEARCPDGATVAADIRGAVDELERLKGVDDKVKMDHQKLAATIADDLFTNGNGDEADHLVLELPNGRNGGGWCKSAVAGRIERAMNAAVEKAGEEV